MSENWKDGYEEDKTSCQTSCKTISKTINKKDCLTDCLTESLTESMTDCLTESLTESPTDCLAESLTECLSYFCEHAVFLRILEGFREKYASIGYAGGTVVLMDLSMEDIELLEGFMGQNLHGRSKLRLSAQRFNKSLLKSRYSGIDLEMLLHAHFKENLIYKKEEMQKQMDLRQAVFEEAGKSAGDLAEKWLKDIEKETGGGKAFLIRKYHDDSERAKELLEKGIQAINELPVLKDEVEYMAVFASRITGDPHYFDRGGDGGILLEHIVDWYVKQKEDGDRSEPDPSETDRSGSDLTESVKTGEEEIFPMQKLKRNFLKAGILKDDISNYAILCGVRAWKKKGLLHAGMNGFLRERESVQISLSTAAGWERIKAVDNLIYIVENPSVYAVLVDKWKGRKSCMCLNGQPNLTAVLILDLLMKGKARLLYAGDFDPEGIWIAQRLKNYCGDRISFWHMDVDSYKASKPSKSIKESRMKILDRITDAGLREVAEEIRMTGLAGYQEQIIGLYIQKDT